MKYIVDLEYHCKIQFVVEAGSEAEARTKAQDATDANELYNHASLWDDSVKPAKDQKRPAHL